MVNITINGRMCKMTKTEGKSYQVPNLERALRIMEHLLNYPDGQGITDIVKGLGYPNNSVFRIMSTLHQNGYLYRDEGTKKFTLSRKLFSMSYGSISQKNLMECSMVIMRELVEELGETVVISILDHDEGLVLEQVPGTHPFRFVCDAGTRQALHCSASTKSIIAFLPVEEQNSIVSRMKFVKHTDHTITSAKLFHDELIEVKKVGYGLDNAEAIEGVYCAAAPIFNDQARPIAAITITGPANRVPQEKLPKIGLIVKSYADKISAKLGHGLI